MKADFDIAAQSYDETFTQSTIGSGQRQRVWQYLQQHLDANNPMRILELNCGTGEDALFLARAGHHVTGTDISSEMIEVCKTKAQNQGIDTNLTFLQMDMRTMHAQKFDQQFDLIFSNFGGLNCLGPNELKSLFEILEPHLFDQGRMMVVVMPRYCFIESLYFFIKLRFSLIFRRNTSNSLLVNVEGNDVKTFYYSPTDLSKLLSKSWAYSGVQSIGFIPSYLETLVRSNKIIGSLILSIDKLLYKINWRAVSDHYLLDVTLKKPVRV